MPLTTGEDVYLAPGAVPAGVPLAALPNALYPNTDPAARVVPNGDADAEIPVYVNQGRWMVECPHAGCGSAQVAFDSDRRFFCAGPTSCGNFDFGGKFVRVRWPDDDTRAQIEELLMRRPIVNRHWLPSESVADLAAENEAAGI